MVLSTSTWPRSMRLAMATSPSRVSSGTVPISRKYMRTGSLVFSSRPGVRSSSTSSLPGRFVPDDEIRGGGRFRRFQRGAGYFGSRHVFIDVNAVALKRREQIVDLFRGMHFGGQGVVDFVVEQVAALLTHVDELAYLIVFFFQSQGQEILRASVEPETLRPARPAEKRHVGTLSPGKDTQNHVDEPMR